MTTFRPSARPPVPATATAPPAKRAQPPGWRDPRLVVGVVIVAVCVLVGARLLAGADDTNAVWRLRHAVPAGTTIDASDLTVAHVHFTGGGAGSYLPADPGARGQAGPIGTATHDLAAGELLPRSAVATDGSAELVEVPLSVAPDDVPGSVRHGAIVDVWVIPKVADPGGDRTRARLALDDVVVVAVPDSGDSLAPSTTQQVIVGVDEAGADDLATALGELADARIVLTRQAGP